MRGVQSPVVLVWLLALAGLGWSKCIEGESWYDGCNSCSCRNGVPLCTKRHCPPEVRLCEEGESWKSDCNSCGCFNGQPICTMRACPPKPTLEFYFLLEGKECEPGLQYTVECNSCDCDEHARARCTIKSCEGSEWKNRPPTCTGEGSWKVDCNYCFCGKDGRGHCTNRICQPNGGYLPECTGDDGYWTIDACNSCTCIEGGAVCTDRECTPEDNNGGPKAECNGEVTWKQDCNDCHCSNGVAVCTEKACIKSTKG